MAKPPRNSNQPPAPRRNGVRDVGSLLPDVGGAAFRRFGFQQSALVGRWKEIVGPVYARWSVPESLRFSRGQKNGGTLSIRVEGPYSLHLQHVGPQIIERVNQILGHGAVLRLRFVAGEVPQRVMPKAPAEPSPLSSNTNLSGIRDEGLRKALEELAAFIPATSGPPRIG